MTAIDFTLSTCNKIYPLISVSHMKSTVISNLHGKLVASVAASVDDVEAGHGHEDVLHLIKSRHEEMRETGGNWVSLPQQGRRCDGKEELPCALRQPANPP